MYFGKMILIKREGKNQVVLPSLQYPKEYYYYNGFQIGTRINKKRRAKIFTQAYIEFSLTYRYQFDFDLYWQALHGIC